MDLKEDRCAHCMTEVHPDSAIYDEIGGKGLLFCCSGCNAIYRLINEEGLEDFYKRRSGWSPGRPEFSEIRPEEFAEYINSKEGRYLELEFLLSGIRCASCIWLIEHIIKKVDGVIDIRVNYATHRARLSWDPQKADLREILRRISRLGYIPRPAITTEIESQWKSEQRDLLIRFGTASFFTMQLMIYTTALYAGYFQGIEETYRRLFQWIAWGLATPVMFYSGYPFVRNAIKGLRDRRINMDLLIFLGSFSAYAYSIAIIFLTSSPLRNLLPYRLNTEVYFDTSATIITLILLGRLIEQGAKIKASSSLQALLSLQPRKARLIRNGIEEMVSLRELKEGDLISVRPGEKIPVDGIIIDGSSEVDEQMLTGESMPVFKTTNSEVFAGTINLNGRLIIKVSSVKDTLLSKITKAVLDAQSRRARIQTVADRVVAWFVPAIILISLGTFLFWYLKTDTTTALMNAIAVLVVACPCALGLATPLAILIGSTGLYSSGIIIKDAVVIEKVAESSIVCLDKTGTVTEGRPTLIDIIAYHDSTSGEGVDRLHLLAASLEEASGHVVARAIQEGIKRERLLPLKEFQVFPGMGVRGRLTITSPPSTEEEILIGNIRFLESSGIAIREDQRRDFEGFSERGYTVTGMAVNGRLMAWFLISDRINPTAFGAINELKRMKKGIVLLTGDHRKVAEDVAERLGIERVYSEVLPVQKAEIIKRLQQEKGGNVVIMVGDGINDAPSLSTADAGIATGGASDIAAESAGAVLMRKDLGLLVTLFKVSKRTLSIIKQNLFWAFSYNIIAIPLAVSGNIHPVISAILMALSSLLVVGNSLRLRQLLLRH